MSLTAAMMSGDVVTNIIVVDDIAQSSTDLNCELIEYTAENPAGIGWTYDRATSQFVAPEETPAE